jgi:DNA (cytosine-5)-methyltransferase 1
MMTHGSLFSGIGGPDLAAQKMVWENVFHCEINSFGQRTLKYYWPNAISYENIKTTDFSVHRGAIDVLTGGFPCQPYSVAGLRKGKKDERHLWPEMLRAIREIKPRWVVGENVLGLVGWDDGLVFEEVQADLEAEGYEVQPYVLPAASVGAPHRRDRVWFVAYAGGNGHKSRGFSEDRCSTSKSKIDEHQRERFRSDHRGVGEQGIATNSYSVQRRKRRMYAKESKKTERYTCSCDTCSNSRTTWDNFPTQSPVCNGNDGVPPGLVGITFSKFRVESIKAGGNAIVHQVILQIFKAIEEYENLTTAMGPHK